MSLFSLPVFYGLPSVPEHQWEAVEPPSHEQGSPPALRGNSPPHCVDFLYLKSISDLKAYPESFPLHADPSGRADIFWLF